MSSSAGDRNRRLIVRIGGVDVSGGVVSWRLTSNVNDFPFGHLCIENQVLERGVEYRGLVVVEQTLEESAAAPQALFTGQVSEVIPGESSTVIRLIGGMPELQERRLGGLSTDGVPDLELLWSILLIGGMPESRIQIEDFEPGPAEPFEVVVPVNGIAITTPFTIERVTFTDSTSVPALADGLQVPELQSSFTEAAAWASSTLFARTLFDAERRGLRRIRHALARTLLRTHYSWGTTPRGGLWPYKRDSTNTRAALADIVLVHGIATGRRWLRGLEDYFSRPKLISGDVVLVDGPATEEVAIQVQEASLAWQRALDADNNIEAVAALWDSLEFYAAGARMERVVSREVEKSIRQRATEGLTDPVRRRVLEVLGTMNSPPLMMRVLAAASDDGVALSEGDIECLRSLRKFRNDFIHGRNRGEIDDALVRHGTGVINRLLVHRLHRLGWGSLAPYGGATTGRANASPSTSGATLITKDSQPGSSAKP